MYVVFFYNNTVISATSDMVLTQTSQIIKSLITNRSIVRCQVAWQPGLHPEQAQKPRHVADYRIPSAGGQMLACLGISIPKADTINLDVDCLDCLCMLPKTERQHSGMLINLCVPVVQGYAAFVSGIIFV